MTDEDSRLTQRDNFLPMRISWHSGQAPVVHFVVSPLRWLTHKLTAKP